MVEREALKMYRHLKLIALLFGCFDFGFNNYRAWNIETKPFGIKLGLNHYIGGLFSKIV